jgi:hypothetical protein
MIGGGDFIEFAGKLAARPQASEAEQRSAISRAYYGACHLAKTYIQSLGIPVSASMHDLPRWLSSNPHAFAQLAGQRLSDLQTQRIRADYDIDKPLARQGANALQHVRLCVERAREVESLLKNCEPEEIKSQVKAGLEQFLRTDPKQSRVRRESSAN